MFKESIVNYLEVISNQNLGLNFLIHIMVLVTIFALFYVKNEDYKRFAVNGAILMMFSSVTINALVYGNPFHAVTFGILTLSALYELFVGKNSYVAPQKSIKTIIAFGFIFIGLWYPEFVEVNPLFLLVMSPVGIIPCPTLLTALGLLTLAQPCSNKIQLAVTIFMGLVYGIIGTFVLKVYLDITLLAVVLYSLYVLLGTSKLRIIFPGRKALV